MLLRLGQDLKKLLTPDPAAVTVTNDARDAGFTYKTSRPSSADWRSMSKLSRSAASSLEDITQHSSSGSRFKPSRNHKHAKDSAIGLRSSDVRSQPELPRTINRQPTDDESSALRANFSAVTLDSGLDGKNSVSTIGHDLGTSSFVSSMYDPDDIQGVIYEREKHFYDDISKNPQLRDQHPLMHLIASQKKLKLADKQSGIQTTAASNEKESIFGTRYGKQGNDTYDKYGIYLKEVPYTISGKVIYPSHYLKQKELEKEIMLAKKKERRQRKLQALQFNSDASVDSADSVLHGSISSSAQGHLDFLNSALKGVEKDLSKSSKSNSLASPSGTDGGSSVNHNSDHVSLNSKSAELLNDISKLTPGASSAGRSPVTKGK